MQNNELWALPRGLPGKRLVCHCLPSQLVAPNIASIVHFPDAHDREAMSETRRQQ